MSLSFFGLFQNIQHGKDFQVLILIIYDNNQPTRSKEINRNMPRAGKNRKVI